VPLIQSPNIARKLQRSLRLTELPDSILAPEAVAVILVEDLTDPLGDIERGCAGAAGVAAVAAEFGQIVLSADTANIDVVVTKMWAASLVDTTIRLSRPTVAHTGLTGLATTFRDFSTPGAPTSSFATDTKAVLPAHVTIKRIEMLANTNVELLLDFRLGPLLVDNSIMLSGENANTVIRGGFEWTERDPQG